MTPEIFSRYDALLEGPAVQHEQQLASPTHAHASTHIEVQGVVHIDCGLLRGARHKVENHSVWAFRGIPYALPPVGKLRWMPPEPLKPPCWSGSRAALNSGSACAQKGNGGYVGSEDCLHLDVYTPSLPSTAGLPSGTALHSAVDGARPVIVFLHGGSLIEGSVSPPYQSINPLDSLAARTGAVVVGVNYRLNGFGFMALEALSRRDPRGVSGNYGLLDQLAALRWVRRNIAHFGGNTTDVTLMGQSSGGTSVLCLMASPLARGLFDRAMVMSSSVLVQRHINHASKENSVFIERAKCNQAKCDIATDSKECMAGIAKCLVGLSMQAVLDAVPWEVFPFWSHKLDWALPTTGEHRAALIVIDGQVLVDIPHTAIADVSSWSRSIPVLIGTMAQEVGLEPKHHVSFDSMAKFVKLMTAKSRPWNATTGRELLDLPSYAAIGARNPQYRYDTIVSDIRVVCPNIFLASRLLRADPHRLLHLYHMTAGPVSGRYGPYAPLFKEYAFHGWDLMILLGALQSMRHVGLSTYRVTAQDRSLRTVLTQTVASFSSNGKPGRLWSPFADGTKHADKGSTVDSSRYSVNEIRDGGRIVVKPMFRADVCQFWQQHNGRQYWWAGE